jgi:hypothetical protein
MIAILAVLGVLFLVLLALEEAAGCVVLAAGVAVVWFAIAFLGPIFFPVAGVLVAVGGVGAVLDAAKFTSSRKKAMRMTSHARSQRVAPATE